MKPYFDDGKGRVIYLGDSAAIAPTLTYEAVVSDPPYGMNLDTDGTRFSGGGGADARGRAHIKVHGDDRPFDPAPWTSAPHCVLWGFHHFAQRLDTGTVLVWVKRYDTALGTFLSDAELAWRKGGHGVYVMRAVYSSFTKREECGGSFHPTQKPEALMRWSIERSGAPPEAVILDPFMGSGTTLVAAKQLGRACIGIEIEERYCEIAARRLEQEIMEFGP